MTKQKKRQWSQKIGKKNDNKIFFFFSFKISRVIKLKIFIDILTLNDSEVPL